MHVEHFIATSFLITVAMAGAIVNGISIPKMAYGQGEQPSITIRSIQCTEEGLPSVEFAVSGVEHDNDQLTYTVELLTSQGAVVHSADITVPPEAPNPATTFISFTLALEEGTYTLRATGENFEVTESFMAPDCTEEEPSPTFKNQGQCIKAAYDQFRDKEITRAELEELKDECKDRDFIPEAEITIPDLAKNIYEI